MAVTERLYQTAHIVIVIAYTLFCAAVLGIEHPILRFVASIGAAIPVLWGVWVMSYARIPVETIAERVEEELRHETTHPRYLRLRSELVAISRDARELDRVAAALDAGQVDRDSGFRELNQIERRMKRRVEAMRQTVSG